MFLQEVNNHENIIRCVFSVLVSAALFLECRSGVIHPWLTLALTLKLAYLTPHRLLNVLKAENDRDIYLIFEYMETDLHAGTPFVASVAYPPFYFEKALIDSFFSLFMAVIRANILEEIHKQYIMYQLFKSLKFMHSAELLHRDVKVSNATKL